jgi:hypothetical protein
MSTTISLLPYAVRSTRWWQIAAGAGSGLLLVVVMTVASVEHDTVGVIVILRLAALLGAIGAAFLLDDPSESSTAVSPVPRRLRMAVRPLVLLPVAVLWWSALLLLLRADTNPEAWQEVPLAGLSLEAATLLTIAVAIAAVAVRRPPHTSGGIVAGPAIVAITVVGQLAPERLKLFPVPGDPHWAPAHQLWVGLLGAALVLLLAAAGDLARRRVLSAA